MAKHKSSKPPPQGKLSAEIIEEICAGIASMAEEELVRNRAWERWIKQATEAWFVRYQELLEGSVAPKNALREAAASAQERASALSKEWADGWYVPKGERIVASLPSQEEFSERARVVAETAAPAPSRAPLSASTGRPIAPTPSPKAPIEAPAPPEGPDVSTEKVPELVQASTQKALEHKRAIDAAAMQRAPGGMMAADGTKKAWQDLFVTDAIRSLNHVRSVVAATALSVVREVGNERARALVDTISRRLAMDVTCGRLAESLDEIRASGAKKASASSAGSGTAGAVGMFWREIQRNATKTLNREDVRRLVARHV